MENNNDRDILLVSVFTFLTVLSWIFFELIKTAKTTTVSSTVKQVIVPLNPNIDTDTVSILEKRKVY